MSASGTRSLRSQLIRCLVPLQAGLLAAFTLLLVGTLWTSGFLLHHRDESRVVDVLRDAITRGPAGAMALRDTTGLKQLRADAPNLWFMVRDTQGHVLTEGDVPAEFAALGPALDGIGQAKLGWDHNDEAVRRSGLAHLSAQMTRLDTGAGDVQVIAMSDARMSGIGSWLQAGAIFLGLALPSFALMTLATLVATPMVIRRAIASLDEAALHASNIDIDKRGTRLPLQIVPNEVAPLVKAVNAALRRLDEGYERHKRFLADAAHELRTPIAILTTRIETLLPHGPEKGRLVEDVAALSTLTDQLLDLQRLKQRLVSPGPVDLVTLCAQVVSDLAPMAIGAGYQISLQADVERIDTWGDGGSLERVVINLVQNAIQHGGRQGIISVAVKSPSTIEVSDQGPGIPQDERERIFEPFHRLRPLGGGAGLGLSLVSEIVQLHRGAISVVDAAANRGACFRIVLPLAGQPLLPI